MRYAILCHTLVGYVVAESKLYYNSILLGKSRLPIPSVMATPQPQSPCPHFPGLCVCSTLGSSKDPKTRIRVMFAFFAGRSNGLNVVCSILEGYRGG